VLRASRPRLFALVFGVAACGARESSSPAVLAAPATTAKVGPSTPEKCTLGRTFILLRHGEKATAEKDTPLSERGRERARVVASLLASTRITRLLASSYRRTQETLAPLATQRGLTVEVGPAAEKEALLAELRRTPDGGAVVVATHSNVLPYVVRELGTTPLRGVEGDSLPEEDFARLAVIALPCSGPPLVVELSSGPT
jgi:phosphohistidine phosphatase SixA